MATVRELVVALGLDFDSTGFDKAELAIKTVKTGFLGVAGVIGGVAAALTATTVGMARSADELSDFAKSIGVSTESVQKLGYAAQLSGSNADTLRAGLTFLARQAEAASSGSTDAAENFGKFGVRLTDTSGQLKTADRLLLDIANGMSGVTNPTERAAVAAQLLGKSAGPQLVQLLAQGEDGIAALGDELEQLGGFMDDEFIESSSMLADTLDRMQFAVRGVGISIARAFLPAVQKVTSGIIDWWRANRKVIDSSLTFYVQRLMSAFDGIAGVLRIASSAFDKFTSDMTPVGRSMMVLAGAAITMALAFASPIAAVAILSLLVLALLDDVNEFVTGGESVLGGFVDFMIEWGKKNGGVLGDFIVDVGRFLKDFQGAGWGDVVKEVNAHFEILANTLGKIWSVLQKITAVGGIAVRTLLPNTDYADVAVEGADKNLSASDRAKLLGKRQQERNQGVADDMRTLGLSGVVDAAAGADKWINNLFGVSRPESSAGGYSTTNVGGNASTTVNAPITINGASDPETTARIVQDKIEQMRDADYTAAHAALVPGK